MFQKIDTPNEEFCKNFEDALKEGPMKAFNDITKDLPLGNFMDSGDKSKPSKHGKHATKENSVKDRDEEPEPAKEEVQQPKEDF